MKTTFKITDQVGDNDVNLGYIEGPRLESGRSLEVYSFAGNHEANVSTFPGETRFARGEYDKDGGTWTMSPVWSSDLMITSKLYTAKGLSRTVPLYFKFEPVIPIHSNSARWDESSQNILGRQDLVSSVRITDLAGIDVKSEHFIHEKEFVPYHIEKEQAFDPNFENVFFLKIYSNGDLKRQTRKVVYSALDITSSTFEIVGDHSDYISLEPIFQNFDTHYRLKPFMGASVTSESYAQGYLNPRFTNLDTDNTVAPDDPDADAGRVEGMYSMVYNYAGERYSAILDAPYKTMSSTIKPCPLFALHYSGVKEDYLASDVVLIRDVGGNLELVIGDPLDPSRTWTFNLTGRSTGNLTKAINISEVPFTATTTLQIPELSLDDVLREYPSLYTSTTGTQSLHFDRNAQGDILVRSSYFITKYTQVPTVTAFAPKGLPSTIPWYPQIKMGGFVDDRGRAYYLNEYSTQQWSTQHGYPYVDVVAEEINQTQPKVIELSHKGLFNQPYHVSIYDSIGNSMSSLIDGIDARNGRVFLKSNITPGNEVFVNYSYQKKHFSFKGLNLNPAKPFSAKIGSYHNIYLKPYIDANGTAHSSTVYSEVSDKIPDQPYKGSDLLLASILVDVKESINDFKHEKPVIYGGGFSHKLSITELEERVPDLSSMTEFGFYDGLRYPANYVNIVTVPSPSLGENSILLEDYSPTQLNPQELKVYNAVNIPPGTIIHIFTGTSNNYEAATVLGPLDHQTLKVSAALSQSFNVGSKITTSQSVNGLFTREELETVVNKFSPYASHQIVEVK